ncbi:tyrosine-type recombinase/integrase [Paenibacillus sp. MER TA 81-3]|uniref:tyrosine-type recombinase/integrase n=1 Tax=Paenibacillus sp. MER TA 81-3 TaxID=2939573 RepID=UPI002041F0AA|nr:site-specific integrase [Paenibacillus sp. MER TA 81-3]MCM3341620.1 tyrosine-type recombinase/integrase [Paenibacillus sp. MER TA 81-3]
MELRNKKYVSADRLQNKLEQEISSYQERLVHDDGSVSFRKVENSYFMTENTWSVDVIGSIANFQDQRNKYNRSNRNIRFEFKNPRVNLEIKYVVFYKLFNDEWSFSSLFGTNFTNINRLTRFLNEKYPRLESLLDLNIEKADQEWLFWLENQNIITQTIRKHDVYGEQIIKCSITHFLRHLHYTLSQLIDTRQEWDKDRWDIRALYATYGINYNKSQSQYFVDFSKIRNPSIRSNVKEYIKQRLLNKNNFSWSTAVIYMNVIPGFLNFICNLEPLWNDLKDLQRSHIFPEDRPKRKKKPYDQIDYIPEYVLEQLFANLNHLHSEVQPLVWIAFKTGLRISDVLGLTQDCLLRINGKYYIETDIEKTFVKGHRIPIDDELANMLAALIKKSIENSNEDNNPESYIFIRFRGSRKGRPYSQLWVGEKLNCLARNVNITDESGNVFYFKTHQFRHTYAIKMLNGGADILIVQELLAHASPDMTMRYAKLLDNTKRKAFETVVKQGVFSFDMNGKIHEIHKDEEIPYDILETLWRDKKLNAIDNPYGSCRARVNGNCPYAEEPPCLTCNGGSPCKDLAVGLSEMDVPKYEIHIQSTSKMIEVAKQYGRDEIAEKNQKNLERLTSIYETIRKGNIVFWRMERIKGKQGVKHV